MGHSLLYHEDKIEEIREELYNYTNIKRTCGRAFLTLRLPD